MMQCPVDVALSPAEGEALITRLQQDTCTPEDRSLLVQILRMYFWLLFIVQEAKLSLKRLRTMLFGTPAASRPSPAVPAAPEASSDPTPADSPEATAPVPALVPTPPQRQRYGHRPGQGRHGAQTYGGAQPVVCRHEDLAVGQRCPVCGRGQLYGLPAGVEIRITGNALLSAIRSTVEK